MMRITLEATTANNLIRSQTGVKQGKIQSSAKQPTLSFLRPTISTIKYHQLLITLFFFVFFFVIFFLSLFPQCLPLLSCGIESLNLVFPHVHERSPLKERLDRRVYVESQLL
jgi:hypothetical protein